MNKKAIIKFFASKMGKVLITALAAIVFYGLFIALTSTQNFVVALIVAAVCAIFGWEILHRFIPVTKTWFILIAKIVISILIGIFVAPFRLGVRVADVAQRALNKMEMKLENEDK